MNEPVPTITLNNGLKIPQLGLGVWQATDDEAEFAVSEALSSGYRLIDTAAMYQTESGVGRAIQESGVNRSDLFVTTKLWNSNQGYDTALKAFDESISKLGLDYIDLYLIHWPVPVQDKYVDTWRAFEQLYDQGVIKAIGVSNFMPEHLDKLLAQSEVVPAVNQIEVHPDFQQRETRDYCRTKGIAIESWSPIGGSGGTLLDNPDLGEIAKKYGKSPAQIAIRWHIQSGLIVIPKSVHAERIKENIDVFDFELDDTDMQLIDTLDGPNRHGPDPLEMNRF
jgi:diketogulonate reductase-like aldo/keto reductase